MATGDEGRLRKWIRAFPEANWAVLAGKDSGVFIVDVDGDEGVESLRDLCSLAGCSLEDCTGSTLATKTARGIHLYYRWPPLEGVPTVVGFMPGLDTRGQGSYALIPPSMHETGTVYEWLHGEGT